MIFVAQFMAIISLFSAIQHSNDADALCSYVEGKNTNIIQYPILLCILYAGSAAVEDLFSICLPFEMIGISKEEYCLIVHKSLAVGKKPSRTFWLKSIFRVISPTNVLEEKLRHLFEFYEFFTGVGVSIMLTANNAMFVVVIGVLMGYSTDLLSLVQNFIAVEVLIKTHEYIARIMRIKDRSPWRFNKNWRQVIHEMENAKAIPIYLKKKGNDMSLSLSLSSANVIFAHHI